MVTEADKSQDLQPASWRPGGADGVCSGLSQSPRQETESRLRGSQAESEFSLTGPFFSNQAFSRLDEVLCIRWGSLFDSVCAFQC